ncbi:MAG: radical SAM protein [bacterium]
MRASDNGILLLHPKVEILERDGRVILLHTDTGHWVCVHKRAKPLLMHFMGGMTADSAIVRYQAQQQSEGIEPSDADACLAVIRESIDRGILCETGDAVVSLEAPGSFPINRKYSSCTWDVTSRCNLRCIHCHVAADNRQRSDELASAEYPNVVSQLVDVLQPKARISLSGGEPLLNRELTTLCRLLRDHDFEFSILTNGTLATRSLTVRLAAVHPSYVQVSFDGGTAQVHDRIRGRGSFERARRGVLNLRDAGMPVVLSFTPMKLNFFDLDNFVVMAHELGIRRVHFPHFTTKGRGRENASTLNLTDDERIFFYGRVRQLTNEGAIDVGFIEERLRHCAVPQLSHNRNCGLGYGIFLLAANGDVYPCSALTFPEMLLGNIRQQCLSEILADHPLLRQFWTLRPKEQQEQCKRCVVRAFCAGGCLGRGYHVAQTLNGIDHYCPVFQTEYLESLWQTAVNRGTSSARAMPE